MLRQAKLMYDESMKLIFGARMKNFFFGLFVTLLLIGCAPQTGAPTPTQDFFPPTATAFLPVDSTSTPAASPTPAFTPTPEPTATPAYPEQGYGPREFPTNVNPLTGLQVEDVSLLERRPMAVKISNLPRFVRPQWGLSRADLVFEYYIEEGTTRFTAIFYGQDAERVGPIRSARFFDVHLVRMYQAIFAYGSGDYRVRDRLDNADFADRLVSEFPARCPPMCRFEPTGANHLVTNTADLSKYITDKKVNNARQNLAGMFFQLQAPPNGQPAAQAFVRYSAAIYNRWDYDPASGAYLRFSERDNDLNVNNEVYAPLTDALTQEQIYANNVVILLIPHQFVSRTPEIVDIVASSPGDAFALRDGQIYQLRWSRPRADSVFVLTFPDGTPYPLKPGNTWFEVMGTSTKFLQVENGWRFTFGIP
jgi:hypothetical protein